MNIEDDAPMTFGQLSAWRSLNTFPRSRWAEGQLREAWALPPGVRPDRLRCCWETLVERHESLRTRFVVDDDVVPPRQVIYRETQPIEFVRARTSEAADLATSTSHAIANRVMGLDKEFGWRATGIIDETGCVGYLSVAVHHIVADRTALTLLRSELESLLSHPDYESDPAPRPRDLARLQRSNESRSGKSADFVIRQMLEANAGKDGVPAESYRILGDLDSAAGGRALREISAKYGISAHSVLLALTAIALNRFWRRDSFMLMLMAGNRADLRWRNIVSSMNQGLPVQFGSVNPDGDLLQLAAELRAKELKTYRHGMYDVDVVENELTRHGASLYAYDSCFNFLSSGFDSAADDPGGASEGAGKIDIVSSLRRTGPRFDLKVRGNSTLQLTLRVDAALLTEDHLAAMLRWYEQELLRTAAGELDAVSDALSRCYI